METLNKHIFEYERVRGWEPRRIYVGPGQYMAILRSWANMINPRAAGGFDGRRFRYMGATVSMVSSQVATKIREWDLAP